MSEQQVQELARDFANRWSIRPAETAFLTLDFTWPSVGLLDLLTQHLRFKKELTAEDLELARGAAAYLSWLVGLCWRGFGATVELGCDAQQGVFIKATAGPKLSEGQVSSLFVEREILKILAAPTSPFKVFKDFRRPITPDQNIITLFALGACLGVSPYGEGPWSKEDPESFAPQVEKVMRILASSSADYYQRIFTDEPWGKVAELYLQQLIYPPALAAEELPGFSAAQGLLEFAERYKLGSATLLKLAANLARFSDETISNVGLITAAALTSSDLSVEILAAAQSRGMYTGLLRAAMLYVRNHFQLRDDWLLQSDYVEDDARRYQLEQQLYLLPWVKIPAARVRDKKLAAVLAALSVFDLENAIKFSDQYLAETPGDISVRIQRVYLDFLTGDVDKSEAGFRALATEPGAEISGQLYNLWGLCDLARGEVAAGRNHLEIAFRMMDHTELLERGIPNDYAWALILNDEFDQALDVLNYAEARGDWTITSLLNKAFALSVLSRFEEADQVQSQLLRLAPLDFRVFSNEFSKLL